MQRSASGSQGYAGRRTPPSSGLTVLYLRKRGDPAEGLQHRPLLCPGGYHLDLRAHLDGLLLEEVDDVGLVHHVLLRAALGARLRASPASPVSSSSSGRSSPSPSGSSCTSLDPRRVDVVGDQDRLHVALVQGVDYPRKAVDGHPVRPVDLREEPLDQLLLLEEPARPGACPPPSRRSR